MTSVLPPRGAGLSFDQTVPRRLAHRWAVSEVFVTDSAQVAAEEFAVATQIPRSHSLWYDRRYAYHDPLATVEAGRQAAFVVVHRYFGVPDEGYSFVSQQIDFEVVDLEQYADDSRAPLAGVFHVRLADLEERDGDLVGVSFRADLAVRGCAAMRMGGRLIFLPRADYELLRVHGRATDPARAPEPPPERGQAVDPTLVGRRDERNVVIAQLPPAAGGQQRYGLVVDPGHPSFFDHPQDHVPGPLIVEALRQSALVTGQRVGALPSPVAAVRAGDAEFAGFAELDALTACTAEVSATDQGGCVRVSLRIDQAGRRLALARVELFPIEEGRGDRA